MSQATNARIRIAKLMLLMMAQKKMTGAELAAQLMVSKATIYRDIQLLIEAGAPVLGFPGDGYLWHPQPASQEGA